MGGRGGYSTISNAENKLFDSIRDKKRENLIVYDDNGNIVSKEVGTKYHTGYEDTDYNGKNVVHNHPIGIGYYPSAQDLVTFHSSNAKSMSVVSKDYTIKITRTNKVNKGEYSLTSTANYANSKSNVKKPFGNMSAEQYRQTHNATVRDTNNMKAQYEVKKMKEIMQNAGYKVSIKRNKK